jgi:hypothetical protein
LPNAHTHSLSLSLSLSLSHTHTGQLELDNWGNPLPNASAATIAAVQEKKKQMKLKELSNKSTYPQNSDVVLPK